MSYCSPTDLANVKTAAELTQLSDLAGTGSPNDTVLQAACDQASSLIDGLISPQYPNVPLANPPAMLLSMAVRLALYYLYLNRHSMPEEAAKGYKNDVDFLTRVGDGKASLGDPTDNPGGDRYHGAQASGQQTRTFDPKHMRGF
jgi:phage gp36-like protein